MSETEPVVLCDIEDGVAKLTLNRPHRRNAFTWQMGRELDEWLTKCDADDAVRAIVVTGAGDSFCAGADLGRGPDTFKGDDRDAGAPPAKRRARRERLEPWQGLGPNLDIDARQFRDECVQRVQSTNSFRSLAAAIV